MRAHAAEQLPEEACVRSSVVDAVVAVGEVSLELARELARFEPCGYGNPASTCWSRGAADGHAGHGRGRQAPAPAGRRRLGALRRRRVGARRGGRVPARRAATTSSAGSRSTSGAARSRRGWCCATSCRGRRASRSSRRLPRGSAPPGRRLPRASRYPWSWPSAPAAARRRWPRSPAAAGPWSFSWPTSSAGWQRCPIRAATAPARCWSARAAATRPCWSRRSRPMATASSRSPTTTASPASRCCASARRTCSCWIRPRTRRSSQRWPRPAGGCRSRPTSRRRSSLAPVSRPMPCAVSWRCSGAQPLKDAATPLEELRARAAWPDVPPPADLVEAAVAALAESGVVELSEAGLRQLAVAGKSDLAASPAYAVDEGWRTRALTWLDALLAGRPAQPAAAAYSPGQTSRGRGYHEISDVDSGTHKQQHDELAPPPGRRVARGPARRRRRDRYRGRPRAGRRVRRRAARRSGPASPASPTWCTRWAWRASAPSCAPRRP